MARLNHTLHADRYTRDPNWNENGELGVHKCRQVENPRLQGFCACGRKLHPLHGDTQIAVRQRNQDFERQAVDHAAQGVCNPEATFRFAQARAARLTPDTVRVGVDWMREAKEEAADFVNYAVWWLEENFEHPDRYQVERALSSVLLAFDCLTRVGD